MPNNISQNFYYFSLLIGKICFKYLNTVFSQVMARGTHLILGSQRGGAYSREALIKCIKKTLKYFQLVSLIQQ